MIRYMCCDSPIGKLVVCEESDRLVAIRLNEIPIGAVPEETSVGKEACSQLVDYFRGQRKDFQLPLAWKGTPFRQRVSLMEKPGLMPKWRRLSALLRRSVR